MQLPVYSCIERKEIKDDWNWYEKYIVSYFIDNLKLGNRFSPEQIHRAVGLINVNAVAMKFPHHTSRKLKCNLSVKVINIGNIALQKQFRKAKDCTRYSLLGPIIASAMPDIHLIQRLDSCMFVQGL